MWAMFPISVSYFANKLPYNNIVHDDYYFFSSTIIINTLSDDFLRPTRSNVSLGGRTILVGNRLCSRAKIFFPLCIHRIRPPYYTDISILFYKITRYPPLVHGTVYRERLSCLPIVLHRIICYTPAAVARTLYRRVTAYNCYTVAVRSYC